MPDLTIGVVTGMMLGLQPVLEMSNLAINGWMQVIVNPLVRDFLKRMVLMLASISCAFRLATLWETCFARLLMHPGLHQEQFPGPDNYAFVPYIVLGPIV